MSVKGQSLHVPPPPAKSLYAHTIFQVRTVSSVQSCVSLRPMTRSIYMGEIPVPGRFAMMSWGVITSPAFMSRVSTSDRRASRRGTSSHGNTVLWLLPMTVSTSRKFSMAFAKSSGSPAVSYTHLDVYKRQVYRIVCKIARTKPCHPISRRLCHQKSAAPYPQGAARGLFGITLGCL